MAIVTISDSYADRLVPLTSFIPLGGGFGGTTNEALFKLENLSGGLTSIRGKLLGSGFDYAASDPAGLPIAGAITSIEVIYANPLGLSLLYTVAFSAPLDALDFRSSNFNLTALLYAGADSMVGAGGKDLMAAHDGNDTVKGGGGQDTLNGGSGNDSLFGEAGHDLLVGAAGNDRLDGSSGNDTLLGGNGADLVLGGGGADTVNGGVGADTLRGDAGADTLTGGGASSLQVPDGPDLFVFTGFDVAVQGETDRITDFSRNAGDLIDLSGIDANLLLAGNQAFTAPVALSGSGAPPPAGSLRYEVLRDHTRLYVYIDGDAAADFSIRVNGAGFVPVAADFVL